MIESASDSFENDENSSYASNIYSNKLKWKNSYVK